MIGPLPSPESTSEGRFLPWWYSWLQEAFRILFANQQSGTTAERPTEGLWRGRRYWDSDLQIPIYVASLEPTVWKDAVGNTV